MRMPALVAGMAILIACGSSSSSGNGLITAPTITLAGTTYPPKDGSGEAVTNKSCTLSTPAGTLNASVSALVAGFSSWGGVCGWVKQNGVCASKQSSQFGTLAIIHFGSSAQGAIGPGTYTIGLSGPDLAGNFGIVDVAFENLDTSCHPPAAPPYDHATGTVTITQTSPTVKGTVNATFVDAAGMSVGAFSGPFEVNTCDYQVDICGRLNGCTSTCVP